MRTGRSRIIVARSFAWKIPTSSRLSVMLKIVGSCLAIGSAERISCFWDTSSSVKFWYGG